MIRTFEPLATFTRPGLGEILPFLIVTSISLTAVPPSAACEGAGLLLVEGAGADEDESPDGTPVAAPDPVPALCEALGAAEDPFAEADADADAGVVTATVGVPTAASVSSSEPQPVSERAATARTAVVVRVRLARRTRDSFNGRAW
jgi:hypothetical protein